MVTSLRLDVGAIRAVAADVGAASSVIRPSTTLTTVDEGALAAPNVAQALLDSSRYRGLRSDVTAERFTALERSVTSAMDQVEEIDSTYAAGLVP
jgi:hypothetical protein